MLTGYAGATGRQAAQDPPAAASTGQMGKDRCKFHDPSRSACAILLHPRPAKRQAEKKQSRSRNEKRMT
jgi:hypothetical protein